MRIEAEVHVDSMTIPKLAGKCLKMLLIILILIRRLASGLGAESIESGGPRVTG